MPSLTLQQFNSLFTTDHQRTLQWGNIISHSRYFKVHINFTLKSLPQSPKQFCSFRLPDHDIMFSHCPPVWSSFTSLLLSFNTIRIAEPANSHISSSQIRCKASNPTLKSIQHPIQWAPEVPYHMVKWLQPNADHTLSRLGMNGAWKPLHSNCYRQAGLEV